MSTNVTWNGTSYTIPDVGELNWSALSSFLIALGNNAAVTEEMKQAIRVATTSPVTVAATTDFAIVTDLAVAGAVAVNLPAGINGLLFAIVDGKGDAATNNVTITPNGAETIAGAATRVLNHNRQTILLQYHAGTTDWKILADVVLPGTITSDDISGTIAPAKGGTGVANNNAATLTRSGNHALTITTTGVTSVTLPTSGTLVASPVGIADGGTGQTTQTAAFDALAPTTTKGDLIAHNGTDNIRVPVGTNGFALVADSVAAAGVSYAAIVTNPMDSDGDMIYGGAGGAATKLDSGSAGQILMANGAAAPTWTNDVTGMKTFADGIQLDDDAAQTTLDYYRAEDVSMTFTFNGGGSPGSSTLDSRVTRIGELVTITFNEYRATTGTGSTLFTAASGSLPSWARPAQGLAFLGARVRNSNAPDTVNVGAVFVETNGEISFRRNTAADAFGNASNAGFQTRYAITYSINGD